VQSLTDLFLYCSFQIKKALRGVRVETTHQQGKRSTYKITGITSVPLAQLRFICSYLLPRCLFSLVFFPIQTYLLPLLIFSFSWDDGPQLTVAQYFEQRYKYRLQYTAWPCLQSGKDSKPIYLPMEVAFSTFVFSAQLQVYPANCLYNMFAGV
jgi:eukaryotic translation initiation factor 2C